MKSFFKGLGYFAAFVVIGAVMFAWYAIDEASFQKAALWIVGPIVIWHLVNEIVVKPIMAEFRELHRRLDVMEGREPRPTIFD